MGTESLVAELLRIAPDIEVRVMHFDARSKSQRRHTTHNRAPPPLYLCNSSGAVKVSY